MSEATPSAAFLFSKGVIPLPLTVMQILAVDLGTDMMPALGLGTELPEKGIMDQPPRKKTDTLMNKGMVIKAFFWYGLMASIISMGAYFFVNILNGWPNVPLASEGIVYRQATAMTLASIVFCQIGAVFNCRTEKQSVFKVGIFSNKRVLFGIAFEVCLLSAIIYVPFLQDIFNTAPIGLRDWVFLVLIPIPIVLIEELRKYLVMKMKSKKAGGK
jgi:magnesium-transporting ATPase (P-type)